MTQIEQIGGGFFQQIQAKIKEVNWKVYPKIDRFFYRIFGKVMWIFLKNFDYLCSRINLHLIKIMLKKIYFCKRQT